MRVAPPQGPRALGGVAATVPVFVKDMVRHRAVAEDWLVSIDGNRYPVPFALIGKTVQVVRLWID
jgi:hypothetical protein